MRELVSTRSELRALANDDLIALWRCDEGLATANIADYGPTGYDLTQAGNPASSDDVATGAADGSRVAAAASDHAFLANTSEYANFGNEFSAFGWVRAANATAAGPNVFLHYGGTGTLASGIQASVYLDAGELGIRWTTGAGATFSIETSSASIDDDDEFVFLVSCRPEAVLGVTTDFEITIWNRTQDTWLSESFPGQIAAGNGATGAPFGFALFGDSSGGSSFNGRLSDMGFASCYLPPEWARWQFKRAEVRWDQQHLFENGVDGIGSAYPQIKTRVLVRNSDGEWVDLTNIPDSPCIDFVNACSWGHNMNERIGTATVELVRSFFMYSLAPEMQSSPLNLDAAGSYAPLLQVKRAIRIESVVIPAGRAIEPWMWEPEFEGYISKISGSENGLLRVACVDNNAVFRDLQLLVRYALGAPGPSYADFVGELQAIINFATISVSRFYLGTYNPELWNPNNITTVVDEFYSDKNTSVLDELYRLAVKNGNAIQQRLDDLRRTFRPTILEPNIPTASVQWTFAPEDVHAWTPFEITEEGLINYCDVGYGPDTGTDSFGDPTFALEHYDDATSIAEFGELRTFIREAEENSFILDSAKALALATLVVEFLKNPQFYATFQTGYKPFLEVGDKCTMEADGILYDTDLTVMVVSVAHQLRTNAARTRVVVRAVP